MAFDPDEFLAKQPENDEFDPDSFLSEQYVTLPEGPMVSPDIQPKTQPNIETPGPSSLAAGLSAVVEPAATVASGMVAEPIAGLAGLATLPFSDSSRATENIDAVRNALTYVPKTQEGMAALKKVAETLQPIAETVEKVEQASGDVGFDVAGPIGGAIGKTVPAAVMMSLGLNPVRKTIGGVFQYQSPAKQKIAELLTEKSTDIDTAKFKLKDVKKTEKPQPKTKTKTKIEKYLDIGGPKIEKDKPAIETIKQGFDEGVVAAIKGSSNNDKKIMYKMALMMERSKKNALFGTTNRPGDIVGESLMNRFKIVHRANESSGKNLDAVAKSLKGKHVNYQSAVTGFMDDLGEMGISVKDNLNLNFMGSDIEGLVGPERIINQIFKRMRNTKPPDAYDLHRMKKFIDEQVSYGKSAEGLTGRAERVIKRLRHNIDGILDSNFKRYDDINTTYSETRGVIDLLQDVAGKKMDLTGPNANKAVGVLMRRLMSNTQSRVRLMDAINDLELTAGKYGKKPKDDLMMQVLFADELDSVFGPAARTSFQGQIGQAIDRSARAAKNTEGAVIEAAVSVAEKLRGINQENAFKAIRKLLKDDRK